MALKGLEESLFEQKQQDKNLESKTLSVSEKLMLRVCIVFVILVISLLSFSNRAYKVLEESNNAISQVSTKVAEQIFLMNNDLNKIESKTEEYARMIENVKSLTEIEQDTQKSRIIPKDSIPNMLNDIMDLIPQQVKILSITNIDNSKLVFIEAESEKYEQLGYFSSILKTENILKNVKSSSGSKDGAVVKITIEGELP